MKIKLMLICVMALTGLTYRASAAMQRKGRFSDISGLLTEVQNAVDKSRSVIAAIDIASLSVTYADGKIIEGEQKLTLGYADRARGVINALRQTQNLYGYLQL